MATLRLCLLLALGCWVLPRGHAAPGSADARAHIEQLRSGSATEREAAQRWLGIHLTEADYPTLAASVEAGDPEMGRRLAMALASESRHLGLVLLLSEEDSDELADIGRAAFEELLARWCPKAGQRPATVKAVGRTLEEHMSQALHYRGGSAPLDLHVDRLDRHAQFGVPLVVEPGVSTRWIDTARASGDGLTLLHELTEKERLTYSGIGEWDGDSPGAGAWILVADMGAARSRSGAQRLLAWLHAVQRQSPRAAAAARALGRCGWPAALEWLDRRWAQRKDVNALQGLLVAASLGRASREMMRSGTRRDLLALADGWLEQSRRLGATPDERRTAQELRHRAEEVARALVGAGGLGFDGEELSDHWIADWSGLSDDQRWLRLVLLEGQRSAGDPVRAFLVDEVQGAGKLSDATRFQALRALAALPSRQRGTLQLGDVTSLVSWSLGQGLGPELARLLHSLGVSVRGLELPTDWSSRLFRLALACTERDVEVAAGECLQIGERAPEATLRALERGLEELRFRTGPDWLQGVAESALKGARNWEPQRLARLERVFLVSGVLALPVRNEGWLRNTKVENLSAVDFERLGAWAGSPEGSVETQFLIQAVRNPPARAIQRAALVKAINRALRRLQESHEDELAARLRESVWAASADNDSPLHETFDPSHWPGVNPSMTIDLIALERLAP